MRYVFSTFLSLVLVVIVSACASNSASESSSTPPPATRAVAAVLDDWHDAAARADFNRYFSHFDPSGVFMGTDATERWTVDQFNAYAKPHFDKGKAWSFTPHDRHIVFSDSGATAWFDEELSTPHLGPCRGSGVLLWTSNTWKIAHYNLSIPIPNDLAIDFVKRIADYEATKLRGSLDGATPPSAVPSDATALNVMTFNIRYDNPSDGENAWPHRRSMVAGLFAAQKPDIVGLQEALDSQLREILTDRSEFASVGVGRDDGMTRGEYAAILYRSDRLSVLDSGTFWFSDTPEVPGSTHWGNSITRICTWARFADRASMGNPPRSFYVFNAHLDHQSQPSRERSVQMLLRRIAQRGASDPVIITGDFNAGESNAVVQFIKGFDRSNTDVVLPIFVDSFRSIYPREQIVGTFNSFRGESTGDKIDYIFVSPETVVGSSEILRDNVNARYPSDHFPVVARIRLGH